MRTLRLIGLGLLLVMGASALAQSAPDKAYLQKIWDGWATLNVNNQDQFFLFCLLVYFGIAPLKHENWAQFKHTLADDLPTYKSATFKVNDDAQVHKAGDVYWATATIDSDMVKKDGGVEKNTFRWTVFFEKQNGKWLIVHEHLSMVMPG